MLKNLLIALLPAILFLLPHSPVSAKSSTAQVSGKNSNKAQILIPEVFELANVAFALTDFSQANENMTEKSGDYYERTTKHFG